MFEGDDVDAGVEGGVAEGESGEVGDGVEFAVVPGGVADGEVDRDVALAREESTRACTSPAPASSTRAPGGRRSEKRVTALLDGGFEVQHVPAEERGKAALRRCGRSRLFARLHHDAGSGADRRFEQGERQRRRATRPKYSEILDEAGGGAIPGSCGCGAPSGSSEGARLVGEAGGIVAQGEMLAPYDFEAAAFEQACRDRDSR